MKITKREVLHQWLLEKKDWVYLNEIPPDLLGGSIASLQCALRNLCESNRADFRIVGKYQYRGKPGLTPKRGPKKGNI